MEGFKKPIMNFKNKSFDFWASFNAYYLTGACY